MSNSNDLIKFLIENNLITDNGNIKDNISDDIKSKLSGELAEELKILNENGFEKYLKNIETNDSESYNTIADKLYEHALDQDALLNTPDPKLTNDEYEAIINDLMDETGYSDIYKGEYFSNPHLPKDFKEDDVDESSDSTDLNIEKIKDEIDKPVGFSDLHLLLLDDAKNRAFLDIPYIVEKDDTKEIIIEKIKQATRENYDAGKAEVYAHSIMQDDFKKELEEEYKYLPIEERPSAKEIDKALVDKISKASSEVVASYFSVASDKLSQGKENEISSRPNNQILVNHFAQSKTSRDRINKLKGIVVPTRLTKSLENFDANLTKNYPKLYSAAKITAGVAAGIGCAASGGFLALGYSAYRIHKAGKGLIKKYREEKENGNVDGKSCLAWAFSKGEKGGWKESLNVAGSGFSFLGGPLTSVIAKSPKMFSSLKAAWKEQKDRIKGVTKPITVKKAAIILGVTVGVAAVAVAAYHHDDIGEYAGKIIKHYTESDGPEETAEKIAEITPPTAEADTLTVGDKLRNNIRILKPLENEAINALGDGLGHAVNTFNDIGDRELAGHDVHDAATAYKADLPSNSTVGEATEKSQTPTYKPSSFNQVDDEQYPGDDVNHKNYQSDNVSRPKGARLEHKEGDEVNRPKAKDGNVKETIEKSKPVEFSKKLSGQVDKFIGKELGDNLEAKFDSGELSKYTGDYTKEEFFHKSAMIRAYLPGSDKEFGNVLEKLSQGNGISPEEAKYMNYLLSNVDDKGNVFCDYDELFGKGPEGQKAFDDIMNKPEGFGENITKFDRHKIVSKLADVKAKNPDEFDRFVNSYKTDDLKDIVNSSETKLSNVNPKNIDNELNADDSKNLDEKISANDSKDDLTNTVGENSEDHNRGRLINGLYKTHHPRLSAPVKITTENIDGKNVEVASLDYSKLSPESKDVIINEIKLRAKELGLDSTSSKEQLSIIKAEVESDAVGGFDKSLEDEHLDVYQSTIQDAQIPKATFPEATFPMGDADDLNPNINDESDAAMKKAFDDAAKSGAKTQVVKGVGVNGNTSESHYSKTTQNADGSTNEQSLTTKNSSVVLNPYKFNVETKSYQNKVKSIFKILNSDRTAIGAHLEGHSDIVTAHANNDFDYSDDLEKYCDRKGVEIKLDGQGYGQYKIPNKGLLIHIDPQNLSDADHAIYDKFEKECTDENGKINHNQLKRKFIKEMSNPNENIDKSAEVLNNTSENTSELNNDISEEKPKKVGLFKRLFGGKDKGGAVIPKIETDANGDIIAPEPTISTQGTSAEDKLKTDEKSFAQRKATLDARRTPADGKPSDIKTPINKRVVNLGSER